MLEYLAGHLQNFWKAIEEHDEEKLMKYAEPTFARLIARNNFQTQKEYEFAYKPAGEKEQVAEKMKVLDKIIWKGVSIDRSKNESNMDYLKITAHEKRGLR